MSLPRLSDLSAFITKKDEHKLMKTLPYITRVINQGTTAEINELISDLAEFDYKNLLRLCQINPAIENFCRTNKDFSTILSAKLKKIGYPHREITSMDGNSRYTVFDLYLAAAFINELSGSREAVKIDRKTILTQACTLGSFNALMIRCAINEKVIKNINAPQKDRDDALKQMLVDIDRLSQLYWGYGYAETASILHVLGRFYLAQKTPENQTQGQAMIEQTVKNFLCACDLETNAYSKEVELNVSNGNSLLSILASNGVKVSNVGEAKIMFQDWLKHNYVVIEAQAKTEIRQRLAAQVEVSKGIINSDLYSLSKDSDSDAVEMNDNVIESNVNHELMEVANIFLQAAAHSDDAIAGAKKEIVDMLLSAYFILKDVETIDIFYDPDDPLYDRYYGLIEIFKNKNIVVNNWQDAITVCVKWVGESEFDQVYKIAEDKINRLRKSTREKYYESSGTDHGSSDVNQINLSSTRHMMFSSDEKKEAKTVSQSAPDSDVNSSNKL